MTATLTPPTESETPTGSQRPARKLPGLLPRLNRQSVEKRSDAYLDIDWDAPELAIGPDDDRCGLFEFDPLAETEWYRNQAPEVQARIGLHRICSAFKVGMQFENLLQRGLLSYAFRLPNGAPEYRYLHHEIIEESQHSLMFQELVNRSGLPVRGMPLWLRTLATVAVPVFNRLLYAGRTRFGDQQLLSRQDGARATVKAMKSGRPFYYLPDLNGRRRDSIFVPFFGIPAATITGLPRLAKAASAAVVPCITRMLPGDQGYAVEFGAPWIDYPSEDVEADTARMNAWIESVARTMPEQYYWVHRRFKTRPPGVAKPY